jgi:hypothetical protein
MVIALAVTTALPGRRHQLLYLGLSQVFTPRLDISLFGSWRC